ncbi:MAG: hypothetical protein KA116_11210 [Proteobacteria bacterium]|nr:hypothetical protein [Pseudomonadota bacterium]
MGLLFAVEPDLKASNDYKLLLKSSKKKFGLGMGMLLGGTFLGTMFYAAKPLFDTFLREGALFDKSLAIFFTVVVALYPIFAAICFLFEKVVVISKKNSTYDLETKNKVLFLEWGKHLVKDVSLNELDIKNWKGAINTAAIKAQENGQNDRYSTRGHWFMEVTDKKNPKNKIVIERRARKDDIDWLKAQIESYFHESAQSPTV